MDEAWNPSIEHLGDPRTRHSKGSRSLPLVLCPPALHLLVCTLSLTLCPLSPTFCLTPFASGPSPLALCPLSSGLLPFVCRSLHALSSPHVSLTSRCARPRPR